MNLLQPQDRRSRSAGDSAEAIEARASLLGAGIGRALIDAVVALAAVHAPIPEAVIVDLGSGAGACLASLHQQRSITGIGIDLSTAAAEHAARRCPGVIWLVANADRRLPLQDRSVDLLLSLHGRRNAAEAARVIAPDGALVIAVPAPDDLIELREQVQGARVERDRSEMLLAEYCPPFDVVDRSLVRETPTLERHALLQLLRGTYRGARHAATGRVASVDRMTVTLSSDVLVLKRLRHHPA